MKYALNRVVFLHKKKYNYQRAKKKQAVIKIKMKKTKKNYRTETTCPNKLHSIKFINALRCIPI